jgi:hypothetical protein
MKWTFVAAAFSLAACGVLFVRGISQGFNYDDLYIIPRFTEILRNYGLTDGLNKIFWGEDIGPSEYRLYGAGRVLQGLLITIFGWSSIGYFMFAQCVVLIGSWCLYEDVKSIANMRSFGIVAGLTWFTSPFAVPFCFHHFTYLILPMCMLFIVVYILICAFSWKSKKALMGTVPILLISMFILIFSGEAHIPLALGSLILVAIYLWRIGSHARSIVAIFMFVAYIGLIIAHRIHWGVIFQGVNAVGARFSGDWERNLLVSLIFWLRSYLNVLVEVISGYYDISQQNIIVFIVLLIPSFALANHILLILRRDLCVTAKRKILLIILIAVFWLLSSLVYMALAWSSGWQIADRYVAVSLTLAFFFLLISSVIASSVVPGALFVATCLLAFQIALWPLISIIEPYKVKKMEDEVVESLNIVRRNSSNQHLDGVLMRWRVPEANSNRLVFSEMDLHAGTVGFHLLLTHIGRYSFSLKDELE